MAIKPGLGRGLDMLLSSAPKKDDASNETELKQLNTTKNTKEKKETTESTAAE